MSLTPVNVEDFGGLSLLPGAEEVGLGSAIDLLNVDLRRPGLLRSRDGFAAFTSVQPSFRTLTMAPFYKSDGTRQLLASQATSVSTDEVQVYSTAGAVVATNAGTTNNEFYFARAGDSTNEFMFCANGVDPLLRWDGASFATPSWTGTSPTGQFVAVQSPDNRLVNARFATDKSRLYFADTALSANFDANNYVRLTPNDGEDIYAVLPWQDSLLVFKQSKFFVFYGNTINSSTGTPEFNYRTINTRVGLASRGAVAAAPEGVYFLDRSGVYLTTGGPPIRISDEIGPFFDGTTDATFASSTLNQAQLLLCAMTIVGNLLLVSVPTGSATACDRVLVFDRLLKKWSLWDIPAASMSAFRVSSSDQLMFGYSSGLKHIGTMSSAYTTDAGTNITSRYRGGFSDLGGPGVEKTVRQTELVGQGTVSLGWSRDFAAISSTSTASVTLGTAPATARGLHRLAQNGELLSYQLASVNGGAWRANRVTPMLRPFRQPGDKSA